jgi:hypothetical protein
MPLLKILLACAVAASALFPASAVAEKANGQKAKVSGQKVTVHPKPAAKYRWRGYGFLPGYRQPPALTDWRAQNRISRMRAFYEPRYVYYRAYSGYGRLQYGWGYPGTYRGRWNGGSFGPCWTQTPIGMVWNCGQ